MQIMQGQGRSCQSREGHGSASPSPCGCDPCNGDLLLELWVLVPLLPVLCGLRVLLAALRYLWGSSSPWAPSAALQAQIAGLVLGHAPSPGCRSRGSLAKDEVP